MIDGREQPRGLGARRDVAGVLVFDADHQARVSALRRRARAAPTRRDRSTRRDRPCASTKTRGRSGRQFARQSRTRGARALADRRTRTRSRTCPAECAGRPAAHPAACISAPARRSTARACRALRPSLAHVVDLGVGEIDDVLADDDAQLGERHPEIGHRVERAIEVCRARTRR